MNRKRSILGAALLLGAVFSMSLTQTACNTTQQRVAYNTLYSLEQTTTGVYDGYLGEVIAGRVSTNDVPAISKKYNQFQLGMQAAVATVQYNWTNAAPPSLVALGQEVMDLIIKAKGK